MVRPGLGPGGYFHPSASAVPRSLQQHSIESSVVTEGHYDASFETEDQAASFDVDPGANYIYLEAAGPPPTLLSNGHFKMCPQELSMLGINQANGGHAASESATQVERRNSTKLNPLSPNGVVNTSTPATAATASDVTAAATTSAATKLSQQDGRKGRGFFS